MKLRKWLHKLAGKQGTQQTKVPESVVSSHDEPATVEASYVQQDTPVLLLPDEISMLILSALPLSSLACLSLTCRQYYWLAKKPLEALKYRLPTLSCLQFVSVIGVGSFCTVYAARNTLTNKMLCVKPYLKEVIKGMEQQQQMLAMVKAFKVLFDDDDQCPPFIMRTWATFQTSKKIYLVGELFNGGELFFHLKLHSKFEESVVKIWAAEMVVALEFMHSKNILLRGIKPTDLVLDKDGHIYFVDFNLIKLLSSPTDILSSEFFRSSEYLSPESLSGRGAGLPSDWWTFGCVIFELLTGLPPFYNANIHTMYSSILNSPLNLPPFLSEEAKSLLSALLVKNPDQRARCEDVKRHPFFENIDWDKVKRKQLTPLFLPKVKGDDLFQMFDPFNRSSCDCGMGQPLEEQDSEGSVDNEWKDWEWVHPMYLNKREEGKSLE